MDLSSRFDDRMEYSILHPISFFILLVILNGIFFFSAEGAVNKAFPYIEVVDPLVEDFEIPIYYKFVDEKIGFSSEERKVLLVWAISGNLDISHFEIERALDNNLDFKKVGDYIPQYWGGEEVQYQFEDDRLPLGGGRVYYRIKQVEVNGNRNYGRTLSVEVTPSIGKGKDVWRTYPNPSINGNFHIGILDENGYKGEPISVRVIQAGNILISKSCFNMDEVNDFLGQNFNNISSGLILIELRWGFQTQLLKIWNLK